MLRNRYNTIEKGCQASIQNELVSTLSQTRPKKHKECQTEIDEEEIDERSSDFKRLNKILDRRGHLIEDAITENNQSKAFLSMKFSRCYKLFIKDELTFFIYSDN